MNLQNARQKGTGTTGSDFDLTLTKDYGIDLRFTTDNYAAFAENIFQLTPKFSVTPGVRYEMINTDLTGVINNGTANVSYLGKRNFPLFGAGLQYQSEFQFTTDRKYFTGLPSLFVCQCNTCRQA